MLATPADITNSDQISNAFNEHFSAIGPRLAREIPLTRSLFI